MSVRLNIKYGPVEVEYEGDTPLDQTEILDLLQKVVEKGSSVQSSGAFRSGVRAEGDQSLGVASIASKLSAKSGSDLILAAALFLEFQGKASYNRGELLEAMKSATGFYRDTYRNNMSTYLVALVKSGKLIQNSSTKYCLHQKTKQELAAQVA